MNEKLLSACQTGMKEILTLHNYVMQLLCMQLWNPYFYLVSLNTYENIGFILFDMKTATNYFLSRCYEGEYEIIIYVENDVICTSAEDFHAKHHNP